MKSKVESRSICRARSERKIAAPFSTPTRMTDSPAKSFVICAPSSFTRLAMSWRGISTLSSVMAFHIKLGRIICEKEERLNYEPQRPQTHVVGTCHVSHRNSRRKDRHH